MQTPRRYAPMGGSFAPVRVAGFKWNGWQASAVYATYLDIFPFITFGARYNVNV